MRAAILTIAIALSALAGPVVAADAKTMRPEFLAQIKRDHLRYSGVAVMVNCHLKTVGGIVFGWCDVNPKNRARSYHPSCFDPGEPDRVAKAPLPNVTRWPCWWEPHPKNRLPK